MVWMLACTGDEGTGESGLEREDLGSFTTEDGFATIPFSAGADAVSIGVYCGPYGYDLLAAADLLTSPSGAEIFDDDGDADDYAMRVGVHSDILPLVVPVSPELDVEEGGYTLDLYVEADSAVTLSCESVARITSPESPAVVDLDLVFVGVDDVAAGLNAAEGEGALGDVMSTVASIWSGSLDVGSVTYGDFDGDTSTYESIDSTREFGDLLRETPEKRTLTVYFVEQITLDDGATILGLAGGPPGTAAVGGNSKAGVVVSVSDFDTDPSEVARIIAHEGGHFLGLFHTSEKDGADHDPLGDTPECTDSAGDGTVSSDDCEAKGAENIMFWAGSGDSTSDDQGWVVSRSAAVQ